MANVKICDRCGAQLEKKCFISLRPVRYILSRETSRRFIGKIYNDIRDYDLCNECTDELNEFLKGKVKVNEPDESV